MPVRGDGRVLVLQRPEGTWDPPGGRLASGETFEAGAVRELYEEAGILASPGRMISAWLGGSSKGMLAAVTYLGRVEESGVRLSGEHLGHRWVTPEEWLGLKSWWSEDARRLVARELPFLPAKSTSSPQPPAPRPDAPPVPANLGAGSVLVDLDGAEPRALLLRRLKPPVGLWENPGGMLEAGEDFAACARRETLEETGIDAEPLSPWWAKVDPWRGPDDPELYAGVGYISRYEGGEIQLEAAAHDEARWVTEGEWRRSKTWYTPAESDTLWSRVEELRGAR